MQSVFLDISAAACKRNPELQVWCQGQRLPENAPEQQDYYRLRLQGESETDLYDKLEHITFRESVHWILQEEGDVYRQLLEPEAYAEFQRQAQVRVERMEPQLRSMIRRDLERILPDADCFNVYGYLCFSAKRLKRLLQRLLQEEYHRLEQELEHEEFIALLRFFVAIQPPLLEQAYLTLYGERFTLTDEWGNDLRLIYLESLQEDELVGVSENDLIMSILITLLPRTIYLEVREMPQSTQFLELLQRVFGEQLVQL